MYIYIHVHVRVHVDSNILCHPTSLAGVTKPKLAGKKHLSAGVNCRGMYIVHVHVCATCTCTCGQPMCTYMHIYVHMGLVLTCKLFLVGVLHPVLCFIHFLICLLFSC